MYLRQACAPNHPSIIEHIPCAGGDNYDRALKVIQERLYNPRAIAFGLINGFLNSPKIGADDGMAILKMVEHIKSMISDLNKLGIQTVNWDCWIMCVLTEKMDQSTKCEYLTKYTATTIPELKHCLTFLTDRGTALGVLHGKSSTDNSQKKGGNANSQTKTANIATQQLAATGQLTAAVNLLTQRSNATPQSSTGPHPFQPRNTRTIAELRSVFIVAKPIG